MDRIEPAQTDGADLADQVELRPVGLDDYPSVRYVHATAFRLLAAAHFDEGEIKAFLKHVYSPLYVEMLRHQNLCAVWLGGEMIGTAAWSPANDGGGMARIRSIYVRPPFAGFGLGRFLVRHMEDDARAAGFGAFLVRAPANAVGFFEQLGYRVATHGIRTLASNRALPVAFMRKRDPQRPTQPWLVTGNRI
ncbi:MAG: GNAT family N-acetyltransferase [Hyphomicrobiaceae bacterium]